MERTFLFYDIETTGLNKAFDQVMQFAAVRTDEDLAEIDRYEFLVRLNPDVIPTPQAMLTHGISIKTCDEGLPEADAIERIHGLMNTPGTTSLGYNTLGFDDEFLRFSFYRNLLPAYSHQYANNCRRMDIYPLAVMYYLYHNDSLTWPTLNGSPTMKLEHICSANDLARGPAHDAMVDVTATLELARKLQETEAMWDYLQGYFDKETDTQRMAKLPIAFSIQQQSFREGLMVNGSFGAKQNYQTYVIALGRHNHYKNQTLWLRLDAQDFSKVNKKNLKESTWVINKKPGEPGLLLPPSDRFMKYFDEKRLTLINHNRRWLMEHPNEFLSVMREHRDYTHPKIQNLDVDAALYQNGFLLPHELQLCAEFHHEDLDGKLELLEQFHNPALHEQAVRYLGRQHPEKLPSEEQQRYGEFLGAVNPADAGNAMIDYRNKPRITPQQALTETAELAAKSDYTEQQQALLTELKDYLTSHFSLSANDHDAIA